MLNSRGVTPTEKSYYISSIDKEKGNSLEFREYAEILEARLNEVGYYKSNALEAALCIQLEYKIGEPYIVETAVKSYGYKYYYSEGNVQTRTLIPLLVTIKANDNKTGDPIWEVILNDNLDRESQLPSVMPFLLLSAQKYFGKNSNGEQTEIIYFKKNIQERYNLSWPY